MAGDDTPTTPPAVSAPATSIFSRSPQPTFYVSDGKQMRYVGPPRLTGWALAFTVVGVSFCFMLLVLFVLAVVFADRLPT